MRNYDLGVLPTSQEYFYIASSFARETLFFLESGGDYQCDENYIVSRLDQQLDSFLLEIIQEGTLYLNVDGKNYAAPKGSVFLLDCNRPHKYYATSKVSFNYVHFSGKVVKSYVDFLCKDGNIIFFPYHLTDVNKKLSLLTNMLEKGNVNEHLASLYIHDILTNIALSNPYSQEDTSLIVTEAAKYMDKFFGENLEIQKLAESSNLSVFYFIRAFKKIHGCTPYDYLTSVRLENSKRLLLTTKLSVEKISEMVGYSSSTNFVRAFKKTYEYTPAQFRNYSPGKISKS